MRTEKIPSELIFNTWWIPETQENTVELYSCMFGFTWVYLWVCNYIYIYMCVCVCVCICVCAPVDVYMCVCVCAFSCASTALRGPTGVGCRSSLAWGRPKRTHQRCCLCSFSTTGRTGRLGFQTELPGHNTVQLLQRFFGSIFMFCHILVRSNIMTWKVASNSYSHK